jgi:hypothetical protein
MNKLGEISAGIVLRACAAYLHTHGLTASPEAMAACCNSWGKIKLAEALKDARDARDCGMDKVATATFCASMAQAGIEAAKECGYSTMMEIENS